MTSRVSSAKTDPARHAFSIALREGMAVGIVGALLLAFIIVFPAITEYANEYFEEGAIAYLYGEPDGGSIYTVLAALIGIVQGLFAFKLLFGRSASTVYFGLGLSRKQLFAARFAAGALWLAAAAAFAMAGGAAVNLLNSAQTALILSRGLYIGAGLLVTALAAYAVTALVCSMSGTLAEALAYSLLALLMPTLLLAGFTGQMAAFLWGNPYGIREMYNYDLPGSLVSQWTLLNPLLFFSPYFTAYSGQVAGREYLLDGAPPLSWAPILGWLAAAAVFFALARRRFTGRKVENTGIRGACRPLGFAVTLPAVYAAATALLYLTSGYESWPAALALALGVPLSAAVFAALYLPLRLAERRAWKGLLAYPACWAATLLVAGILASGGFGYARYVPEAGDVASMEISYKGLPGMVLGHQYGSGGSGIAEDNYNTTLTLTDPGDIRQGVTLHKALLDAGETNASDDALSNYTVIRYTLGNGRAVTRFYDETTYEALAQMQALDETEAFAQLFGSYMDGTAAQAQTYGMLSPYAGEILYLATPLSEQAILLDGETAALVRRALLEDFAAQTTRDRYFPSQSEQYVLYFVESRGWGSDAYETTSIEGLDGIGMTARLYVDASYMRTAELLSSYAERFEVPEIEWIEVAGSYADILRAYSLEKTWLKDLSPFFCGGSEADREAEKRARSFLENYASGGLVKTEDPARIDELMTASRGFYFTGDGGYLIYVKLKDSGTMITRYIPKDLLPDWVIQK